MKKNTQGFVVILSVLIIAAIGASVSLSLLLLSVNNTQTAASVQESNQAKNLAMTCAELALQRLSTTTTFIGTGSSSLGQGTCTYTVSAVTGTTDTIKAVGTVNTTVRRVQVNVTIPSMIISSWQEVGDFN